MFSCMPFGKHVDYLDKRQCNLSQIPEDILRYARSVEELLLDSNHIKELSKPLFRFHKLRRLALSDNEIARLPPDISSLPNLMELDLSKNDISDIPENIKLCKNLHYLDISNNPIIDFPSCIIQLSALTHLGLNDISLAELPSDIGQLVNLHILELRDNVVTGLPASITQLTKLRVLDLGTNELERLPPEVGKLVNLVELYIDGNSLEYLPKEIASLTQLSSFDVAENKLLAVPDEIGELRSMSDLTLSQNCLEGLPHSIGKLKKLTILKLDKNRLISMTPAIGSCTALAEMVLTENLLSELPSSIGNLRDLTVLNLDKNRLRELPYTLGCCTNLAVLSLRDNLLTVLVDEIGKLEKLRVLDVSGNKLQHLPYTLNALTQLHALWLSDNQSQPLLKLQTDTDLRTGVKVLTCYLLPQPDFHPDDVVKMHAQSNGPSVGGSSFAGGPKVHFPDVDQDSGAEDEAEHNIGKFERHDTPHPKHGPKPKGRQIDGHVIHHDESQAAKINDQLKIERKSTPTEMPDSILKKESSICKKSISPKTSVEVSQTTSDMRAVSPSKNVSFPLVAEDSSQSANNQDDEMEESKLKRRNTPHPLKSTTVTSSDQMEGKVSDILARTSGAKRISSLQIINISIVRNELGLGLSIAGGVGSSPYKEDDAAIFISKVMRNGAAHMAGLAQGDKLLTVDGRDVTSMDHNDCVDLMKRRSDGRPLHLTVARDKNADYRNKSSSESDMVLAHKLSEPLQPTLQPIVSSLINEETCIATTIKRDQSGDLGFTVAGGRNTNYCNDGINKLLEHLYVNRVVSGGSASRDGKLRVGDRIVSINGVNVLNASLEEANSLLGAKRDSAEVHLVIQRKGVARSSSVSALFGPATSTALVAPGGTGCNPPRSINGTSANTPTLSIFDGGPPPLAMSSPLGKATTLLVEDVKLVKGNGPLGLSIVGGVDHSSHPFGIDEPGVFISKVVSDGAAAATGKLRIGDRILKVNGKDVSKATHQEAVASLVSKLSGITLSVRHDPQPIGLKEITITKVGDERLGINICGGVSSPANLLDPQDEGIFVSKISQDGAAHRDGRLNIGDRLLEVNNKSLLGASQSDAADALRQAGPHVQLLLCDGFDAKLAATALANQQAQQQRNSSSFSADDSFSSNKDDAPSSGFTSKNQNQQQTAVMSTGKQTKIVVNKQSEQLITSNQVSSLLNGGTMNQNGAVATRCGSNGTQFEYRSKSTISLPEHCLAAHRLIGAPVPRPYVSKMPGAPRPTTSSLLHTMYPSKSTAEIQQQIDALTLNNCACASSDLVKPQPMPRVASGTMRSVSCAAEQTEPVAAAPAGKPYENGHKSRLPVLPPKTSAVVETVKSMKINLEAEEAEQKLINDAITQSKIPSAAKPSQIPSLNKPTTPLTPTGETNPEKLPFTRKLEKFQQEIEHQSTTVVSTEKSSSKLVQPKKVQKPLINEETTKTVAFLDENDTRAENGDVENDQTTTGIPSIVRTKKAENRMKAANEIQHQSDHTDLIVNLKNNNNNNLSPAESRALEAAKRAEWRKARLKSLERDALKAEKVISLIRDESDGKGEPDADIDDIDLIDEHTVT